MIEYKVFMRHAAKVCNSARLKSLERLKMLRGVKHLENGDAVATDAHRLYFARAIHDRTDGAVIMPNGKVLEGRYLDVSRIIPDVSNAKQEIEIYVGEMFTGTDIIQSIGKLVKEIPGIDLNEDKLSFTSPEIKICHGLSFSFESPICLNAQYLLEALKLFKAAKYQTVIYRFYGGMRPVTLSSKDESLLALILPIRKY